MRVGASSIAIGLATALAVAPVHAAPEASDESASTSGSTVIAVEMAASVERGEALAEKMAQEGARLLQAHRIPEEIDAKDPKRVWIRVDGTDYDWTVTVSVEKEGEVVEALAPAKCECTKEELIDRAMQGVVDLLPVLRGDEPAGAGPENNGNDGDRPPGRERKPLGGTGKAGVALIVVGASGAIAGAVLLAMGRKRESGANPETQDRVDYRAPGGAVLGVGLAALIVGAVLVGVDRSRARKQRATVVPVLSPRWVGVSVGMRF